MSRNAFPALEREYTAELERTEAARERLAEWRAWIAAGQQPDTAESVQQSAIAEHASMRIPGER